MHGISIPKNTKNSPLSFTEGLQKELRTYYDLIRCHQWYGDLLNGKLTEHQFETLIAQQILITDWLSKRTIRLTIDDPSRNCDLHRRIANFLLDKSFSDLKLLNTHIKDLGVIEQTREYIDYFREIWLNAHYVEKLITLLPILWIHNSIRQHLISEPYHYSPYKEWLSQVISHNPCDLLEALSYVIDREVKNCSEEELIGLQFILTRIHQFELSIRNEAYHSTN